MQEISEYIERLDYLVVVVYLLVLIGIGFWVSFRKKKGSAEQNLFLAGNSLGATSIGLTMWGTNVGPSMLIASCSIGYTTGVVAGNFSLLAFPFILLLAFVFAPKYMDAKTTTLPEFMGKRFGQSTREILAWYSSLTILISWLGLTLLAGGIIVQQVLGISFLMSCIILVAIAVFFTVAGGLEAIAYTNVFQMTLLILVSLVLTVIGVLKAGSLMNIYESTPKEYWNLFLPIDDPNYPWIALVLGYPVLGVWFWCTDQSMVQSVLGAKSLSAGQMGTNLTAWLKILDVALFILPGITCLILFPNLSDPNEAYMTMVTQLLPNGAIGLILAVIIASLISTIDSALNSLSTVFTMDIYVRKYRPNANNKEIIRIGRIVTVVGAVGAVVFAMAINTLEGLNLFDIFQSILGFLAPPLSVVFLLAVLWKRMTTKAANFTLSVGTIISLTTGALYLWVFPQEEYGFWPHFLLLSFYIFCLLAVLAWLIAITDKSSQNENTLEFKPIAKVPPKVKLAWGSLLVVMVVIYFVFNGHHGDGHHGDGHSGDENSQTTKDVQEATITDSERDRLVELVMPMDSINADFLKEKASEWGISPTSMLQWKNRIFFAKLSPNQADDLVSKLKRMGRGEVLLFADIFYDYNRSWCKDTTTSSEIKELYISTNMVADEAKQKEYIRLHQEQPAIWSALSQGFCNEGFQYVTMYKNGRQVVLIAGYPSDKDLGEMSANNAKNNPKVKEWDKLVLDFQEGLQAGLLSSFLLYLLLKNLIHYSTIIKLFFKNRRLSPSRGTSNKFTPNTMYGYLSFYGRIYWLSSYCGLLQNA